MENRVMRVVNNLCDVIESMMKWSLIVLIPLIIIEQITMALTNFLN